VRRRRDYLDALLSPPANDAQAEEEKEHGQQRGIKSGDPHHRCRSPRKTLQAYHEAAL
jgi:hypothetical protein